MSNKYITIREVELHGPREATKEKIMKEYKYPIKKSEDGNLMLNMFISEDVAVRSMMIQILEDSNRVDQSFKNDLKFLLSRINGHINSNSKYDYVYNVEVKDLVLTLYKDYRNKYTINDISYEYIVKINLP